MPSPGEGTEITQIAASLDCFLLNWLFVGISVLFAAKWIVHASINHISLFCYAIDNLHFLTMCILLYIPIVILFSFNRNTHYGNQIKLVYISYFLLLILLLSQSKLSHTVYRRLERGGQI